LILQEFIYLVTCIETRDKDTSNNTKLHVIKYKQTLTGVFIPFPVVNI